MRSYDIKRSDVVCDEVGCGWRETVPPSDIPKWHNVPCPSCLTGIIVDNNDMAFYRTLKLVVLLQRIADPFGIMKRVAVKLSSLMIKKAGD